MSSASTSTTPSWFVLSASSYEALSQPLHCAKLVNAATDQQPLPPAAAAGGSGTSVARARLQPVVVPPRPSSRSKGLSLCSRERREREISARLQQTAVAAKLARDAAEASLVETRQQLEEGVILDDGSLAPVKKQYKKKTEEEKAAIAAAKAASAGDKRKSPIGELDGPQAKAAKKAAKAAEKEAAKAAEKAAFDEKIKARRSKIAQEQELQAKGIFTAPGGEAAAEGGEAAAQNAEKPADEKVAVS